MSKNAAIRVLVVEDEPLIAEAHGKYVQQVPGFALTGIAHSGQEALRIVKTGQVDVILLDLNLPDLHGLEVCRALRAGRAEVDVIAVTSTRDLAAVRSAVSLGVVQYLLKPFTFRALQDKLEQYRQFRTQMSADQQLAGQSQVDRALSSLRGVSHATLPSGLTDETLESVSRAVQSTTAASAAEIAQLCGVSRVTARRYLEHLADAGVLMRRQRHGGSGRPEIEYSAALHQ
jgi:response regulator of citrate/malate metabolism